MCASDGNHGLAVAAGAELAGASARIYCIARSRVTGQTHRRRGAEIVWIDGTYDDAVTKRPGCRRGEGLLIADTAADAQDPVVADVMTGYEMMADEIVTQLAGRASRIPRSLRASGRRRSGGQHSLAG